MKRQIVIFSTSYKPFIGGAEIAVEQLTKRLSDRFSFSMITYRFDRKWPKHERVGTVDVWRLGYGTALDRLFLFPFLAFWRGWRLASNNAILWGVMVTYASIGAYFIKLFNPQLAFVLTLQEGDSEGHLTFGKMGFLGFWWKKMIKKADHIQAISQYLADRALRLGARCPITVVPNGVELERFRSIQRMPKKAGASTVIITTSRLVYKNGVDILVRAAASLKKLLPNKGFNIRIVGHGPEEEQLKKLARDLGISDMVDFAGQVPPEQIPHELTNADIFVRASRSEGLGNSFLEAMAAGLPVVGTSVGGIRDFLKDRDNGLVIRAEDPEDLADKLAELLRDKEFADKLAVSGKEFVFARYDWKGLALEMGEVFDKVEVKSL